MSSEALAVCVMIVPIGAVTLTVMRTVHVLFGAMLLPSLQTTGPVAPTAGCVQVPNPGVPEMVMLEKLVPGGTCVVSTSCVAISGPKFQILKA